MRVIEPSWAIEACPDHAYEDIERAGRTCYQSSHKVGPGSAERFVRMILDREEPHESVIEHVSASVRFVCDRGFSHELVRQRISSFSQESTRFCVAGDTMLTTSNPHNRPTIAEIFANKTWSSNGAWKRMKIRQLNETTGELTFVHVQDVTFAGRKPTLRLRTHLGYTITLTGDHEVYTEQGYVRAEDLHVGDRVAVNGTEALYRNEAWLLHQYTTLNKTAVQIAEEFGFVPETVKKWVRKHALPSKPHSYWNHGRTPWNKGLTEGDDPRVHNQADALREHHWDGGHRNISEPRADRVKKPSSRTSHKLVEDACAVCGTTRHLQVHHIDENRDNNSATNLITLCVKHHQRVHSKNLEVVFYDSIVEVEPAGVVAVYDISVEGSSHNFVANGVVVHNCNYAKDRFGNEITVIRPVFWEEGTEAYRMWHNACHEAELNYFLLLKLGAKPEEARTVLPNSLKTEIVMTANFREWRHVFRLRTALAAHPQMRQLMNPTQAEFHTRWPAIFPPIISP